MNHAVSHYSCGVIVIRVLSVPEVFQFCFRRSLEPKSNLALLLVGSKMISYEISDYSYFI